MPENLRKIVDRAVEEYNRFRAPEAVAEVVDVDEERGVVRVRFSGAFCKTCGINDWVEDFAYVLMEFDVDARLDKVIEPDDYSDYRIGVFRVERARR